MSVEPQTPPRRFTLRLTTVLVVLAIAMASWLVISDVLLRHTNCGGNSAASWVCHYFANFAASEARQAPGLKLADLDWREAGRAFRNGFVTEDEFLVAPPRTHVDPTRRDVLIACKTAFGNVPEPRLSNLYHRNLAHAVGYSNGEVELISPAEYARLDLSAFVPAEEWPQAR